MKKMITLSIVVLVFNSCCSQEEVYIELMLDKNDKLKFELTEYNEVYNNENLIVNDSSLHKYEIQVLSEEENGYIIKWKNKNIDNLEYSFKVPVDDVINNIINSLEYKIVIDTCGGVVDVNNWENVKLQYQQLFHNLINSNDIPVEVRNRCIGIYGELFNTKEEVITAAKDHTEIIFSKFCQQYSLEKQKREIISMSIPVEENIDVSVEMISKVLSKTKDVCVIDFTFEYDKESLKKASISDLQLYIQYNFNIDEGWLNSIELDNEIIQDEYIIKHKEKYRFL